jgi:hypothetical protein
LHVIFLNTIFVDVKNCFIGMKRCCFVLVLLILASCEDEAAEPDLNQNKGTQLTEIALMGANGKSWSTFEGTLEYISSTGQLDSVVNLPLDLSQEPPITWFGDNRGTAGLHEVYFTSLPFTEFLPEYGTWVLDMKNQTIAFTCNGRGVDCSTMSKLNGTWIISSYVDGGGELLHLEKMENLPNQRKLKKKISLGKLGY